MNRSKLRGINAPFDSSPADIQMNGCGQTASEFGCYRHGPTQMMIVLFTHFSCTPFLTSQFLPTQYHAPLERFLLNGICFLSADSDSSVSETHTKIKCLFKYP
jgi:hypothetical protein